MWIARDKNERLYLFQKKPTYFEFYNKLLEQDESYWYCQQGKEHYRGIRLWDDVFLDIRLENSPHQLHFKPIERDENNNKNYILK